MYECVVRGKYHRKSSQSGDSAAGVSSLGELISRQFSSPCLRARRRGHRSPMLRIVMRFHRGQRVGSTNRTRRGVRPARPRTIAGTLNVEQGDSIHKRWEFDRLRRRARCWGPGAEYLLPLCCREEVVSNEGFGRYITPFPSSAVGVAPITRRSALSAPLIVRQGG